MTDPAAGPQRSFVTQFFRPFQQPRHQLFPLLFLQQWLAPSAAHCLQRPIPRFGHHPGPAAHRLAAHLRAAAYLTLVVALFEQLQRFETSPLQSLEIALYATGITHTAKALPAACWLRYIMRDSVSYRPIAIANSYCARYYRRWSSISSGPTGRAHLTL